MRQQIINDIKNKLDDQGLPYSLDNIKKIYDNDYKLPYGYRWFNGATFNQLHTDLYNKNCLSIVFNTINGFNKGYVESLKNKNYRLINWYYQENRKIELEKQKKSKNIKLSWE